MQNALFQFIRERCEHSLSNASSRFANILLLLPSIAKLSAVYHENFQLAKMFGCRALDPLLAEILLDSAGAAQPPSAPSPLSRARADAATQTGPKQQAGQPPGQLLPPAELSINTSLGGLGGLADSSTRSSAHSDASALSSVSSLAAEDSALENIIALRLEMEQRAAQAKAEAERGKLAQSPAAGAPAAPGYGYFLGYAEPDFGAQAELAGFFAPPPQKTVAPEAAFQFL